MARTAGLDKEAAAEAAWNLDQICALRSVHEEALGTRVHGVRTIATREEVLYYGAASPERFTLYSPNGKTPAARGGISFYRGIAFAVSELLT